MEFTGNEPIVEVEHVNFAANVANTQFRSAIWMAFTAAVKQRENCLGEKFDCAGAPDKAKRSRLLGATSDLSAKRWGAGRWPASNVNI